MLNLKLKPFSARRSREELEAEIESLRLDNELLIQELQYIKYITEYPPLFKKGDIAAGRYLVLEFKPFLQYSINEHIPTLLAGVGTAVILDFIFNSKFQVTKKYLSQVNKSALRKPSWKYRVFDKKLNCERELYETQMAMAGII